MRIPLYETIAFSSLLFINSFFKYSDDSRLSLKFIKSVAYKLGKESLLPAYSYFSSLILSGIIREYALDPILNQLNIDASGHAIIQALHLNFRYLVIEEFSKINSPLIAEIMSTMNKVQLLSELVWSFHTAADCHSPIDIAAGLAIGLSAVVITNKIVIPELKKRSRQIFF